MAKRVAPVKLTGGRGFSFEDKVAAWHLAHLLTGRASLGADFGKVTRIDFQVGESGWRLDDMLITFQGLSGSRRAALSVKSNAQVSRAGFPADFVRTIWEHWIGWEGNPFEPDRDQLCLITTAAAASVEKAWELMLAEAIYGDPGRVAVRLTAGASSKLQKALFASLQCPADLRPAAGFDPGAAAALLAHLRWIRLSFEEAVSVHERDGLSLCQAALAVPDDAEVAKLWRRLQEISKNQRGGGGYVDLPKLLSVVRREFRLRDFPDHEADWQALHRVSQEAIQEVRTDIAGTLHLARDSQTAEVAGRLDASSAVVLIGESGWGKSAIARAVAEDTSRFGRVLWFTAQHLDHGGLHGVERQLGVSHEFPTLLQSVSVARALLVVDGLDRFSDDALRCVASLIKTVLSPETPIAWSLLATSQPDGWERAARVFVRVGVPIGGMALLPVEEPAEADIREALLAVAPLRLLATRRDLLRAFSNLKILDWVASASAISVPEGTERWIGVPDLVDWVWEYWQGRGTDCLSRGGVLRAIGEIEGEALASGVSETRLGAAELGIAGSLARDRLLRVRDGRLFFPHDLAGDWARYRSLVSEPDSARITRLSALPRWHAAIRLYGQRLLERGGDDCAEWRALVRRLADAGSEGELGSDILLDSAIFAVPPAPSLERLWPDLRADGGALLGRLLNRFLHVATVPDPRASLLAGESEVSLWLSSAMRLPLWYFWGPMLVFLRGHHEEVITLAPGPLAEICTLWLRNTPAKTDAGNPWPWRREAAELALALSREVQAWKCERVMVRGVDELAYEAAFYGAPDLPDEVSALALELSRRRPPAPEILARAEAYWKSEEERRATLEKDPAYRERMERKAALPHPLFSLGPLRGPWPEGPEDRVDEGFQKACLEKGAIVQLASVRPEVAKEVILALCIRAPYHDSRDHDVDPFDRYALDDWLLGSAPMYFKGPFLHFLQAHPEHGLDLIIRLVNFATDRWREGEERRAHRAGWAIQETDLCVSVRASGGPVRWFGDAHVYAWYLDLAHAPKSVAAALMALEKWFYDRLQAEEDITPWVDMIWRHGRSAAFAGVLLEIAKSRPALLEGPFLPLLGIWQAYSWDRQILMQGDLWTMSMMLWTNSGEMVFNLVRDWHTLPHRKMLLRDVVVRFFVGGGTIREFLEKERIRWSSEANPEDQDEVQRLAALFDIGNYTMSPGPEKGTIRIDFNWPAHLRPETEKRVRRAEENMQLLTFPMRCRKILDGEGRLGVDEVEGFWHELRAISEMPALEPDHDVRPDAVSGGIAVLIRFHRDWLREDEAREQWCVEQLRAFFASPPTRRQFDMPEAVGNMAWDCFAAEAGVALLAEDNGNGDWRAAAALSVLAFHHSATAIALHRTFSEREHLGDDFVRLVNVAVLWAGLAYLWPRYEDEPSRSNRLRRWASRLVDGFVLREIPASLIPWDRVANFAALLSQRRRSRRFSEDSRTEPEDERRSEPVPASRRSVRPWNPGLHEGVLPHAFGWLPTLDQARTPEERALFLRLYEELLQVSLDNAPEAEEERRGSGGVPSAFDRWVFGKLARLIVRHDRPESAERFWRPIFELGSVAHNWVEFFLMEWFTGGVQAAPSLAVFTAKWRRMIEFSMGASSWKPSPGRYSYDLCNMHTEVMGLRWGARIVGGEEFVDQVRSLSSLYEVWAKQWLGYEDAATAFAGFVTRPAGAAIICQAIGWLDDAMAEGRWYRWESRLQDALIGLLARAWESNCREIESDEALRSSFLRLLSALVKRQIPAALELHDSVLSSSKRGS
ncbi:MAG: hypothetical protein HZB55_07515 [Deltaproteobacteria bacterium]|nr:hypothetical protein [Deltaproteobacteria bacterium]